MQPQNGSRGFILALTIFLILGITAISVGTMFNGKMGRMSSTNYKHKIQTFAASDGLVTLLAQELINGNGAKYVDTSRVGKIYGQEWTGLPGDAYSILQSAIISSPTPSKIITSDYLGSHIDEDDYGIRWTGWIIPPLSGNYTFYTRSDDASAFYLSTDATQGNLSSSPVCWLDHWVFKWPTSGTGVSKPVPLIGGNRYYFEYLHKEGCCFDIGQMGWDGPEFFAERPISGKYLSPYSSDPAWAGSVMVGDLPVRYQVLGTGLDKYRIFTESIDTKTGNKQDTSFRAPLEQTISLKGPMVAPPATLWMRVIFYDFKSDHTNPEFNMPDYDDGLTPDMVRKTLTNFTMKDAAYFGRPMIPKPTKNISAGNHNCGMNMWFQDWIPVHNVFDYTTHDDNDCKDTHWEWAGDRWKNKKYYDSLAFTLDVSQGPYTYVYSRMGNVNTGDPNTSFRGDSAAFFPLDKYGEDPVGSGHNFGFCMELHTTFQYQSALKFEFTGDDDVWVFINDSLSVDLGGTHPPRSKFLNLDDLTNLKFGNTYSFDLFQCERHEWFSSNRMVTNIKMALPTGNPVANWHRDYGHLD